ncbi:hypothetical protein ACFVGY_10295 [Streptomyces sp. NPDC127106]|uniref:hypothetical protein n=1 Tax=Streptomyces sp. NPDC127106 TaxID=3345360 RepID=UPI00362C4AF2
MDAAELDQRDRTHDGWIPPHLVTHLLDHGHRDTVTDLARTGDWFCAVGLARTLAAEGRHDEALELLAPYTATGWWKAAARTAELYEGAGRPNEAVEALRPAAESGERSALAAHARLLARAGRATEAYELLRPHVEDWFLAEALVDVTAGLDRDEEVAALLAARIGAARQRGCPWCDDPACGRRDLEPSNAIDLLASVRERQGRTDEAIALLHTRDVTSVNHRDQLADLLARHDRIYELRAYAAAEPLGDAARRLAELLEERGDVDGAVAVLRSGVAEGFGYSEVYLAELLARHGRGDEAIEVLRSLWSADDCLVDHLCTLYADQGRAEEGLAHLDELRARTGRAADVWEVFRQRPRLLLARGRVEEAIEVTRSHPEGQSRYAVEYLAHLLTEAGHPERAVALLGEAPAADRKDLAVPLLRLGRVQEAVAVLQLRNPPPVDLPPVGYSDTPPF